MPQSVAQIVCASNDFDFRPNPTCLSVTVAVAALARPAADRTCLPSKTLIAVDLPGLVRLALLLLAATALAVRAARMATATEALDASTTTTELLVTARLPVAPWRITRRPEHATKTRTAATTRLLRPTRTPTAVADRTTAPRGTFLRESPRTRRGMGMLVSMTEAGATGKFSAPAPSSLGLRRCLRVAPCEEPSLTGGNRCCRPDRAITMRHPRRRVKGHVLLLSVSFLFSLVIFAFLNAGRRGRKGYEMDGRLGAVRTKERGMMR